MRRRALLLGLGGALVAPPAARAQQKPVPVIGYLNSQSPAPYARLVAAFRQGLEQSGYVEGKKVSIEYGWADGHNDRLQNLADDFARRRVAVIAAAGGPASALAARNATNTIPIVFVIGSDPVKLGLVASFARPHGNATGINFLTSELEGKRLGLLREMVPQAAQIAILLDPNNPSEGAQLSGLQAAARAAGQQIAIRHAASVADLDRVLATPSGVGAGALLVGASPFFNSRRRQIIELVGRLRLPAIYEGRQFAEAGGLMSYGTDLADADRQAGLYVGEVLKGAKPADLPVLQPTKFELVINLKTAKALGLTVPQLLLSQADQVIE